MSLSARLGPEAGDAPQPGNAHRLTPSASSSRYASGSASVTAMRAWSARLWVASRGTRPAAMARAVRGANPVNSAKLGRLREPGPHPGSPCRIHSRVEELLASLVESGTSSSYPAHQPLVDHDIGWAGRTSRSAPLDRPQSQGVELNRPQIHGVRAHPYRVSPVAVVPGEALPIHQAPPGIGRNRPRPLGAKCRTALDHPSKGTKAQSGRHVCKGDGPRERYSPESGEAGMGDLPSRGTRPLPGRQERPPWCG